MARLVCLEVPGLDRALICKVRVRGVVDLLLRLAESAFLTGLVASARCFLICFGASLDEMLSFRARLLPAELADDDDTFITFANCSDFIPAFRFRVLGFLAKLSKSFCIYLVIL